MCFLQILPAKNPRDGMTPSVHARSTAVLQRQHAAGHNGWRGEIPGTCSVVLGVI